MDHSMFVQGHQAVGELHTQSANFFLAQTAFGNHLIERLARNELHDEEIDSRLGVEVVNGRDIRVVES
jgi:hypothetical protein